ncbi:MAG TPA: hypothetical protein H9733_06955 [Candidatus Anaerotignum merdipullorum]|nr:hypothetical protein [Candidatus Anaerotignum merdipullorum]
MNGTNGRKRKAGIEPPGCERRYDWTGDGIRLDWEDFHEQTVVIWEDT